MATSAEWRAGYARQADADFKTFQVLQHQPIPECHKLQFFQMACEKLVKAHLCQEGTDPSALQHSHAYVAGTLPVVLKVQSVFINFTGPKAKTVLQRARRLSKEIDLLAPAVKRGGQRPDNCEYPWEDAHGTLHVPLDWTFYPSLLLAKGSGGFLKLVRGAIDRLM